jgi:hypothetical protein
MAESPIVPVLVSPAQTSPAPDSLRSFALRGLGTGSSPCSIMVATQKIHVGAGFNIIGIENSYAPGRHRYIEETVLRLE